MATNIGDLVVRVGADTSGLTKGLRKGSKKLDELSGKARKGATDVAKFGIAATAAGIAVAAGLVVNSAAAAKEISNLSKLADTSSSNFQKMAAGAKTVGIEQDKLSDILKDTKDRVGDFLTTGGGPMVDFFEQIAPKVGVTAEQFRELSGPDALQLYVTSLEKANVSQAEFTFFMEAMASDATALIPLLKDGGRAMAEQAREAEELGLVLSDIDVERLAQLSGGFGKSAAAVGALADQLSADLTPVLQTINSLFLDAIKDLGGMDDVAETVFNNIIGAASFVADAVGGVGRTFEVVGKSIAVVGLGVVEASLMMADAIINGPVLAANLLIEKLNELSGLDVMPISLTGLGQTVQDQLQLTRVAVKEGIADIAATLAEPLPGTAFEKFVADAQIASDEAAAIAEAGHVKSLEDKTAYYAELDDIILAGEGVLRDIEAKTGRERIKLAEHEAAAKQAALGDALSNLATLMSSQSKKMFKIGKVAAIANTIISTYQAAQNAYSSLAGIPVVGPALGTAAAGAAIIAGFARVQSIKAQQFGGGGSPSSAASGGGAAVAGTGAVSGGAVSGGQTIGIQGLNPNDLFTGSQFVDLINKAQENGSRLVVL